MYLDYFPQRFNFIFLFHFKASYRQKSTLADVVTMAKNNHSQLSAVDAKLPNELKEHFQDVQTEQAIILHDNLELHDRYK